MANILDNINLRNSVTVGTSNQVEIVSSGHSKFPSIKVNNNGYLGSLSVPTAIQLLASGDVVFSNSVGIGTTSPVSNLTVDGGTGIYVRNSSGGTLVFDDTNVADTSTPMVSIRGVDGNTIFSTANRNSTTGLTTGTTERMRIDSSGRVGIGESNPTKTLHINSGTANDVALFESTDAGANLIIKDSTSTGLNIIGCVGDNLISYTNGTERMRIDASGNVGINCTPSALFDVQGAVGSTRITGHQIFLTRNGNNEIYAQGASSVLALGTNSTERMRIDSSGNVGIGTNSPKSKLHVAKAGNSNGGSMLIGLGGSGTDKWSFLAGAHYNQDTGSGNGVGSAGIALIGSFSNITENRVYIGGSPYELNAATSIHFNTHTSNTSSLGGSERMRITSGGNIGIGTTNPIGKLQVGAHTFAGGNGVYQDARIGSYVAGSLTSMVYASTYNSPTYPDYGMVFIHGADTSNYNVWSISPDGPAKGDSLNFIYGANASNIHTVTPRVVFDGNGNVGIGTALPTAKLTVSGISTGAAIDWTNTTATTGRSFRWVSLNSGGFAIEDLTASGANRLTVNASGNIGIGTNSPSGKLTVDIDSSGAVLDLKRDNGVNGRLYLTFGSAQSNFYSSGLYAFNVAGSEKMRITSAGNVGIGTTNPVEKLSVDSGNISMSDSYSIKWGNNYLTGLDSVDALRLFTAGSERIRIDSSGNVGIGTITPDYKLDVLGNIRIEGVGESLLFDTTGVGASNGIRTINDYETLIYNGRGAAGFAVIGNSSIRLGFGTSYTAAQSIIYIPSSGNVGIGTTTPSYKVHSTGTGRFGNMLIGSGTYLNTIQPVDDTNMNINTPSGSIYFNTQSGSGVYNAAGNFGIGTTSPSEKLEVLGNIRLNTVGNELQFSNHNVGAYRDNNNRLVLGGYGGIHFNAQGTSGMENQATRMVITDSGFVGIGTTTPSAKIHITGANQANGHYDDFATFLTEDSECRLQLLSTNDGNDASTIILSTVQSSTDNRHWVIGHRGPNKSNNFEIGYTTSAAGGNIGTGNFADFLIKTNGDAAFLNNLGIGTTSPISELEVNGDIRLKNFGRLYLWRDNSSNYLDYNNWITSTGATQSIQNTGAGGISLKTGVSTRLFINSSGNVGIGTTSPNGSRFHVHQPTNLGGTANDTLLLRTLSNTGGAGGNNVYVAEWARRDATGTNWETWRYHNGIYIDASYQTPGTNTRVFWERDPHSAFQYFGSGSNYVLTIDGATNKVGIGTTSPTAKLHVVGGRIEADSNNTLPIFRARYNANYYTDFNSNGITFNGSGQNFNISDNGTNSVIYLKSGGNVGIGTTTPAEKLDVAGTIRSNAYEGKVKINSTATNGKQYEFISIDTGNLGLYDGTAYRLWVGGNGNIGIGTTSPAHNLDVNGTARVGNYLTFTTGTSIPSAAISYHTNGYLYIKGGGGGAAIGDDSFATSIYCKDNSDIEFSVGGNGTLMVLKPSGNLGIGTTSPTANLSVYDSSDWALMDFKPSTSSRSAAIIFRPFGTVSSTNVEFFAGKKYTDASDGKFHLWRYNGSSHLGSDLIIDSTGNVGVGDDTPSYKLDVDGTIRASGDVIAYSDARVKENVKTIDNALDKVTKLRGVEYNKIGEDEQKIGVIAQEIEQILPQVVQEDENGMKSVAYGNIVGVLIEAIKEQQKQIDELKDLINTFNK